MEEREYNEVQKIVRRKKTQPELDILEELESNRMSNRIGTFCQEIKSGYKPSATLLPRTMRKV